MVLAIGRGARYCAAIAAFTALRDFLVSNNELHGTLPDISMLPGLRTFAASANAFISRVARGARSTAIGIYLSFYYFGGSLGSVLPVPAWNRWGWVGCVAFVVGAQALAGALVFFFWRGMPPASAGRPRSPEVRLTR